MQNQVFWITGLSGSGKTTIGKALYERLREQDRGVVFLDGDEMRAAFGNDLGYTLPERKECAMRYAGLCRLLGAQGLTVVCCTISMFNEVRAWNREHIPGYTEVYVYVSPETLVRRDQKGMYSAYQKGSHGDMMGLDLGAELPLSPDITIENEEDLSIEETIRKILEIGKENNENETR